MKRLIVGAALVVPVLAIFNVVTAGQATQTAAPATQTAAPAAAPSVHGTATTPGNIWLPAKKAASSSPPLTPQEEMKTFSMPPGYHAQLVAAEPLIESPIIIDFDPDGRMWVLELQGFLPDTSGRDTQEPVCDVAVLEDLDGNGTMDKRTVFADHLVLPRALKVLDHGVLVGEPPNLWLMKDTNGDLKADTKESVYKNYGRFIGGVEHNANGLLWAMDNVLYTSEWNENLRLKAGKFEVLPSLSRGQWQASQDDAGRVYRDVNDAPLFVDYTPARYFLRNPNAARTRGLYESLIDQMAATVYPIRQNRGVNRGYRDPFFRADGSSIVIQGAGSPTVYRGDKYPADVRSSVFITDSPTNLVHRFDIVDDGTGKLTAKNAYARGEFLASSDERFRPVNLSSAPDGTLYVVDMYRGVVQDGGIWSDYLREYIKGHDLELPVERGRIWRMVYGNGAANRGPKPSLSAATPAKLVDTLSHPNGWWRDTAQRLLVERNETSVIPALRTLAASAPDWRTKLHALWTLDGLGATDVESIKKALVDQRGEVRAAAVRLSEPLLGSGDAAITKTVVAMADDKNWNVRRQVAASIGELPAAARTAPAISMLKQFGSDPIMVDAVISGIGGAEEQVLLDLIRTDAPPAAPDAIVALAATITRSGNVPAIQRLLAVVTDEARPAALRLAVLQGVDKVLPAAGAPAGRGGRAPAGSVAMAGISTPGAGEAFTPGRPVALTAEPADLVRLSSGPDPLATVAKTVVNKFDWPNRPVPTVIVAPLNEAQQKQFAAGAEIYKGLCVGCHQEDGKGRDKIAASLVDSAFVKSPDPNAVIRVLLSGKEGSVGLMPPVGGTYNDDQIAAVLTYVRRSWGNTAPPVDALSVLEVRGLTRTRNKPWTDDELKQLGGRGGGGGANTGRGARGG
jgi:mono/diheme cytochrome c family protein/glucose/arabinose dehydrogenase